MLKLAFDGRYAVLDPAVARAAVEAAHQKNLQVAAHALDVAMVKRALAAGASILSTARIEPEYYAAVSTETLAPVTTIHGETLVALAARVGDVRLIDNVLVQPTEHSA